MRSRLGVILGVVATLFIAPVARAGADCDCAEVSHSELVARSGLIFLGTVESVRDSTIVIAPASHGHERVIHRQAGRFRMLSIWKGVPLRRLTVFGLPKGYCNEWRWLEAGQTYLVYADSSRTGWNIAECGGPAPASASLSSIAGLGPPVIVPRLPARKSPTPH